MRGVILSAAYNEQIVKKYILVRYFNRKNQLRPSKAFMASSGDWFARRGVAAYVSLFRDLVWLSWQKDMDV